MPYTHITFVLDESGSMYGLQSDTIGGFNKLLADQKAIPGKATISVYKFNGFVHRVGEGDLQHFAPLTPTTYHPNGATALLDAVGRAVTETGAFLRAMPEAERPEKVVCVIITDGQENASHVFTKTEVREMIEHQRAKYSWEFVFLGANIDAFHEGGSLGIPMAFAGQMTNTKFGTQNAYNLTSSKLGATRSVGASMSYTVAEQEALKHDVDVSTIPSDSSSS